jgi:hypothetical protein
VSLEKYEPRDIAGVPHCAVCEARRPTDRDAAYDRPCAHTLVEVGVGWERGSLEAKPAITADGSARVRIILETPAAMIELELKPADAQEFVDELTEALPDEG